MHPVPTGQPARRSLRPSRQSLARLAITPILIQPLPQTDQVLRLPVLFVAHTFLQSPESGVGETLSIPTAASHARLPEAHSASTGYSAGGALGGTSGSGPQLGTR